MKNLDMRLRVLIGFALGILLCGIALSAGVFAGMKISSTFSIDNSILNFIVKAFIYYLVMVISVKIMKLALNIVRIFQLSKN